jgi:hypothetical protein
MVELLIALSLALMVGAAAVTVMTRQQRLYRELRDIVSVRLRTQDATEIFSATLRGTSIADSIRVATDTAVELFTTIGASVVCTAPTSTTLTLPPDTLANGNTLTAFLTTPDSDDVITIFTDSSVSTPTRGWHAYTITAVSRPLSATACPITSHFTTLADVAANAHAYRLTLSTIPTLSLRPGAPLRALRRARYNIYRASDGLWYLGYRRCHAMTGSCVSVQPVSGPYASLTGRPLTFTYFTSTGTQITPTAPTTAIARIDITAHATTSAATTIPGFPHAIFTDSAVATIALRNAP